MLEEKEGHSWNTSLGSQREGWGVEAAGLLPEDFVVGGKDAHTE